MIGREEPILWNSTRQHAFILNPKALNSKTCPFHCEARAEQKEMFLTTLFKKILSFDLGLRYKFIYELFGRFGLRIVGLIGLVLAREWKFLGLFNDFRSGYVCNFDKYFI